MLECAKIVLFYYLSSYLCRQTVDLLTQQLTCCLNSDSLTQLVRKLGTEHRASFACASNDRCSLAMLNRDPDQ
jgi:hypothetical protein